MEKNWINVDDDEYYVIDGSDSHKCGAPALEIIHDIMDRALKEGLNLSKLDLMVVGAWGSDYNAWTRIWCDENGIIHADSAINPQPWDADLCDGNNAERIAIWKAHIEASSYKHTVFDIHKREKLCPKDPSYLGGLIEDDSCLDHTRFPTFPCPCECKINLQAIRENVTNV